MKKLLYTMSLIVMTLRLYAYDADSIFIGSKATIYSKVLNENRKLWIYSPEITSLAKADIKKYPVLYLLDGDAHFYSTVGIIQQLSQANGNGVLPEMIVVAIENTNRLRDLTPSLPPITSLEKANPFINFLSSELFPYVEKNFNAAPYRLLVGHSLGGLTAVDILTNFPKLFNAYIAIDPSMWYNNEKYLNNTLSQIPQKQLNGIKLFVGTANTMPKGMTVTQLRADKSAETQHIRSIFKMDEFLGKNKSGLLYNQVFYKSEKHNTVPLLSIYDGLKFIFRYYLFDASENDFLDSSAMIALKLKMHYENVTKELGYKVSAPQAFINYLGYDALVKKQYNKADALFKLNIEWYPNSFNVYDSYGDFLISKNDTTTAITYYKKAISIKSDPMTIRKLSGLEQKSSFHLTPEELRKYQGVYTLETYKIDIILQMREGKLWAKVAGQPEDEFVPISKDVFTVKGKQGYNITFKMNADKPLHFISEQPNGVFKAVFKNE